MFGWEFPPHNSGGLGVACYGLTKALSAKGINIKFVLPRESPVEANFLDVIFARVPELEPIAINSPLHGYINVSGYGCTSSRSSKQYGTSLFAEVMRYGELATLLAMNNDFDVIHAHDWLSFPAGIAVKHATGKPLVAQVHATEFDRTGGNGVNQAVYDIEKSGLDLADKIIAVSSFTKNILIKHYNVSPEKISIVHNGIDLEEYHIKFSPLDNALEAFKKRGKKVVLFVGRFSLQKNPDVFIKSAARVLELEPDTIFVMAGSGDMKEDLTMLSANLGISDKVLFTGFLRGNELNRIYKSADLFVMPSISEPFGIVPLESLINGTPVIISKQSGVSEVIKNALKVDFWDEKELSNKIIGALRHSPLRENLAANGYKEAMQVTWEKAANKVIDIYQNLS